MQNQTTTLNSYLESKGVTTHLNHKRQLAKALGIHLDKGTNEEQSALLRGLQLGSMATIGEPVERFKVEVAFSEEANAEFTSLQDAQDYVKAVNTVCRISRTITISQII